MAALATPAAAQSVVATPNGAARDLGNCLIGKSTGDDRIVLMRWLGSSMAMAPQLSDVVKVDQAAKDAIDREMAGLFLSLFGDRCGEYTKVLLENRDQAGIKAASAMLGEIAMGELLSKPEMSAALGAYQAYIDEAEFAAMMAD